MKEHGIIHQKSTPRTPEQNGVSERLNLTIMDRVHTILIESQLPLSLSLGARCPGNQWEHLGYIAGSGSFSPQCIHQSHLGYIRNVTSTCVQHVFTNNIQHGCH